MGKHNGKARTSGVRVGAALTKQARRVRGLSCIGIICMLVLPSQLLLAVKQAPGSLHMHHNAGG